MLVILETTPPSPVPANARPQMAVARTPPPPLQEKQGPYFLWLQAGFRPLCPLIYQRTAVLRHCDGQSPLPSVSLAETLLYLPLSSSIFSLQSPSFTIPSKHVVFPPVLSKSHGPTLLLAYILSTWTALRFLVFCTHTNHRTLNISQRHSPRYGCSFYGHNTTNT